MSASKLYAAGYRDLVCVIPPNAELSKRSTIHPDQRGKTPGKQNRSGTWGGYPWLEFHPSARDAAAWDKAGANIGLCAERFPAIDIDVNDEVLAHRVADLALKTFGAAPIRLSRKPRLLLVYRTDEPFGKMKLTISKDGAEHAVEILGNGQQYLVHGTHPKGAKYRWNAAPLWEFTPEGLQSITKEVAHAFLSDLATRLRSQGYECKLAGASGDLGAAPEQDDLKAPSEVALAELVEMIPNPADGGWDQMVKVGCAIKAAATDFEPAGLDAFLGWCARWEGDGDNDDDTRDRANWESFKPPFRVGWGYLRELAGEHGHSTAADDFEADPNAVLPEQRNTPEKSNTETPRERDIGIRMEQLEALNEKYAVVQVGADVVILQVRDDDGNTEFMKREAFGLKLSNRLVPDELQPFKNEPLAKAWLAWPGRREYDRVVFKPGVVTPSDEYNLWRGWATAPTETGSCDLFLRHLLEVVCSGDRSHTRWLLDWMAHIFQHPMQKPGTVVGLQGGQGAGKSIVGAVLKALLGRHQVVADKQEHVTGRFNEHLAHCLLLQAEEAFWGGSKQAAGALKHLVTGSHILIERKGIDSVEMENYTRLLITSNEDQVWPTSIDDRRLAIFRVSNAHTGDDAYFEALFREMNGGGYGRLLHMLLNRKIDAAVLKRPPTTEALQMQASEAMAPHDQWLLEVLTTGVLRGRVTSGGAFRTTLAEMYESYKETVGKERAKNEHAFSYFVRHELGAKPTGERERVDSRGVVARSAVYRLPPLGRCRYEYSNKGRAAKKDWPEPSTWTGVDEFGEASKDLPDTKVVATA